MDRANSHVAGESPSDGQSIKIGIRRLGSNVQISLHCGGDYRAIEAYERLVDYARKGEVSIDLRAR
jgi:hypothetical protein